MSNTTNASGIAAFEVKATSTGNITVTVSKAGYNTWRTKEKGIVMLRPFSGCTYPPTDPDDDGLYEDINGMSLCSLRTWNGCLTTSLLNALISTETDG